MQIITCPPFEIALKLALARLRMGNAMVYPTDTIYGIGCDALNPDAIKRVMEIKRRRDKPLSVMFDNWESAKKYVDIDTHLKTKLEEITPGPYTFLLPLKQKIPVTSDYILGVRIVDDEFCKRICSAFGGPIVSTSANISGEKSPASVFEISEEILQNSELIIDGGPSKYLQGSTIIDVESKRILRRGAKEQEARNWIESL